jgi:hypothetical protein
MRRAGMLVVLSMVTGWVGAQAPKTGGAADIRLEVNELEQSVRCNGNAVYVAGNSSRLSILGKCTTVYVTGNQNWISVEHAVWIVTKGSRNSVTYMDHWTRFEDKGQANSIAEKWQQ